MKVKKKLANNHIELAYLQRQRLFQWNTYRSEVFLNVQTATVSLRVALQKEEINITTITIVRRPVGQGSVQGK